MAVPKKRVSYQKRNKKVKKIQFSVKFIVYFNNVFNKWLNSIIGSAENCKFFGKGSSPFLT
uniref:Ribosomal protein L32 n=1 Tax=Acavomonas peruviana TaxID=1542312 RepID=V5KV70_9ALVE|nr:ribosomal protein L32 [Acavomonas peruviana]